MSDSYEQPPQSWTSEAVFGLAAAALAHIPPVTYSGDVGVTERQWQANTPERLATCRALFTAAGVTMPIDRLSIHKCTYGEHGVPDSLTVLIESEGCKVEYTAQNELPKPPATEHDVFSKYIVPPASTDTLPELSHEELLRRICGAVEADQFASDTGLNRALPEETRALIAILRFVAQERAEL